MNDARIQEAIALLDLEVPREGARVALREYGGGPDESQIVANRQGFLRLGIELLKAACTPTQKDGISVNVDLDYLLTDDSDIRFDWFERREPDEERRSGQTPAAIVGLAIVGVFVFLLLVGLISVVRWFTG